MLKSGVRRLGALPLLLILDMGGFKFGTSGETMNETITEESTEKEDERFLITPFENKNSTILEASYASRLLGLQTSNSFSNISLNWIFYPFNRKSPK